MTFALASQEALHMSWNHPFASVPALCALLLAPALNDAHGATAQQDVRMNRSVETLEAGHPVFGLFTANLSLQNARALATSQLDFLFIDMEHSPFDMQALQTFLLGMQDVRTVAQKGNPQMDVTPIVRVPMNGREPMQWAIKQVLDMGAFGIMVPFVDTGEEALAVIQAIRYPQPRGSQIMEPLGQRGSSPSIASWFWGVPDYRDRADTWPLNPRGDLLAVLQIESPLGVENIDEIITVPGVGAIFIGPADLSLQYGLPGNHPEVVAAIDRVLQACLQHNVPCGITTSAANVEARLEEGFRFVTVGYWGDAGISDGTSNALGIARRASGRDGGEER
ncbi:MAG: aldolase [Gemmatimonadales bacterium]|nr:MAG: aldolase [Gemmatimonadales bacterium]